MPENVRSSHGVHPCDAGEFGEAADLKHSCFGQGHAHDQLAVGVLVRRSICQRAMAVKMAEANTPNTMGIKVD